MPIPFVPRRGAIKLLLTAAVLGACGGTPESGPAEVTFPISALGAESEVVKRQLRRFMAEHPDIRVLQRETPDAADQRHQLFVQWLNAGASDPDILSLD